MDVVSRARAYVSKCPPAVSGQSGHDQTFSVATALVHGFCLSSGDAWPILSDYNRGCQPPWSESELRHKLESAVNTPHEKPRGFLLGGQGRHAQNGFQSRPMSNGLPKPVEVTRNLPDPIPDGARALLGSAFEKGEGIRIVPARLNDEGREVPDGEGPTLSRQEWLRKLDGRNGDPNGIWRSASKTGIYIGINPLKLGGSRDADVTAFRHALVEFDDKLSIEEQWNLYVQSNLPCSAVIFSGGKSLHAWVRVDARDRPEYDQRVKTLWEHFGPYGLDGKNKNPSRLSRLPNCVRFDRRQELLALNIGAPSFTEWLADREAGGLGQEITLQEMLQFDPTKDPNCVLGNRWLCKGASCLWIGQSGVGKSSMAMQAAICWALSRSFFGVYGSRPLKSLIIQHENDLGDLSEMLSGVLVGLGIGPEDAWKLRESIVIIRERTHTGKAFLPVLQRLIERHHPDLVWVDPLYTYLGDDINSADVCSEWLCQGLGPITEATGVIWMMMHHTAKPSTDPKSRRNWTQSDYSYYGAGSAVLTNWFRASVTMLKRDEGIFELQFGKRGRRAGAKDLQGNASTAVYLRHSEKGIFWEQIDKPADPEPEKKKKGGRPTVEFNPDKFCESLRSGYVGYTRCVSIIADECGCSERKAKDLFREVKHRLSYDSESKMYTFKGPP